MMVPVDNMTHLNLIDDGEDILYNSSTSYDVKYPTDQVLSIALQPAYNSKYGWVTDLTMMKWARAVMDFYKIDIPGPCGINCKTWGSQQPAYTFDVAVNYFKEFGYRLTYTTDDCEFLTNVITSINSEIENVAQEAAAKTPGIDLGIHTKVLNDLKTYFNTWIANLDCVDVINNAKTDLSTQQQLSLQSAENSLQAQSNLGTNILLYVMIGAVVVVAGIILVKRLKND